MGPLTHLSRPLTPGEVEEVTRMARRLAAIVLMEPALNTNYLRAKEYSFVWPKRSNTMLKHLTIKEFKELPGGTVSNRFQPPEDPVFGYLLEEAVRGRVPVFFTAVPLNLIRPYAPEWHPENTPEGKQVLEAAVAYSEGGKYQYLWVYPRQEHFVMSDDYFTYAAALNLQPDFLHCMVLGHPNVPGVKDAQGPIRTEDIRRLLLGE